MNYKPTNTTSPSFTKKSKTTPSRSSGKSHYQKPNLPVHQKKSTNASAAPKRAPIGLHTVRRMRALMARQRRARVTPAMHRARFFRLPLLRSRLFTNWVLRGAKQKFGVRVAAANSSIVLHHADLLRGPLQGAVKHRGYLTNRRTGTLYRTTHRAYDRRGLQNTEHFKAKTAANKYRIAPALSSRSTRGCVVLYQPTLRAL